MSCIVILKISSLIPNSVMSTTFVRIIVRNASTKISLSGDEFHNLTVTSHRNAPRISARSVVTTSSLLEFCGITGKISPVLTEPSRLTKNEGGRYKTTGGSASTMIFVSLRSYPTTSK